MSFNVRGLLAHDRLLFSCIFIVFLLVISLVLIGLLLGVMFGLDLWVEDVNIILTFGSMRKSVGLGFSALSVKE
jgi:ABC-type transport system involved in multi-copper enzyme maturation permease subunit